MNNIINFFSKKNINISLSISLFQLIIITLLGLYLHYYLIKKLCKDV